MACEGCQSSASTAPAPPGGRAPAEDVAGRGIEEAAAAYVSWGAQDVGRVHMSEVGVEEEEAPAGPEGRGARAAGPERAWAAAAAATAC